MSKFTGFRSEALQFLAELRDNNNRDWFNSRKSQYEELVKQPMEQLVNEVAIVCQKQRLQLFAKDRSPVNRIYRDIRFSPDKRPYHYHVSASLYGKSAGGASGEMYIHIAPPGSESDTSSSEYPNTSFNAAGFYMPDPAFLRLARTRIAERPKDWQSVASALKKKGLELSVHSPLKRMPRGFERFADSPIAEYLKITSMLVTRKLEQDVILSPRIVTETAKFAMAAKPLLEFGWSLGYKPPAKKEL